LAANLFGNLVAWLATSAMLFFWIGRARTPPLPLAAGFVVGLLAFYGVFRMGFRIVQRGAGKLSGLRLPLGIRHGMRNLVTSGSTSEVTMIVLAFAAMLTVIVGSGQTLVVQEIMRSLPMSDANLYVMGFPHAYLDGISTILRHHAAIQQPYDIRTFGWFRVNSQSGDKPDPASLPFSMVACSTVLRASSGVTLDTDTARRLRAVAGSRITLISGDGRKLDAIVQTVRDFAPADKAWSSVTIPCSWVDENAMFHHAGLNLWESEVPNLRSELRVSYPWLTIVTPQEIFEEITNVVGTGAALVKFSSLVLIVTALVVATALMAASSRQRARELAVVRMLGGSRFLIHQTIMVEVSTLGFVAGLFGSTVAILLMDAVLSLSLRRRISAPHWTALGLATIAGVLLGMGVGWLLAAHIVRQRPFIALRRD